ncbi:hypothetical protein DFA_08621 [Cavenderia fasciculata]|uniref:Transmembrane protein n=1 Tax=Cavenderia fasciculata TaxID=261658 RepID=F4Q3B5_CACFS|nr:uncharacterized protein DFA_08621 [Cavenderia fasciculata]EGG17625.1 hypothetical protein DFA_08621 [Cavenderia fasciculata]|eukprot:XP_004356109.1 hypothetical protein DFA_08621 [Cavenderia fasciculata]
MEVNNNNNNNNISQRLLDETVNVLEWLQENQIKTSPIQSLDSPKLLNTFINHALILVNGPTSDILKQVPVLFNEVQSLIRELNKELNEIDELSGQVEDLAKELAKSIQDFQHLARVILPEIKRLTKFNLTFKDILQKDGEIDGSKKVSLSTSLNYLKFLSDKISQKAIETAAISDANLVCVKGIEKEAKSKKQIYKERLESFLATYPKIATALCGLSSGGAILGFCSGEVGLSLLALVSANPIALVLISAGLGGLAVGTLAWMVLNMYNTQNRKALDKITRVLVSIEMIKNINETVKQTCRQVIELDSSIQSNLDDILLSLVDQYYRKHNREVFDELDENTKALIQNLSNIAILQVLDILPQQKSVGTIKKHALITTSH